MRQKGIKHWKIKDAKPTLWQKLNRKHEFTVFSKLEKSLILCTILFGATFFSSFVYYSISVVSGPSGQSLNGDPFTPIWNGSIYNTGSVGNPQIVPIPPGDVGKTICSTCVTTLSLNIGNLVLVSSGPGPCTGISDNRTNVYSTLTTTTPFGFLAVFGSKITHNGNTIITLTGCPTTSLQIFTIYSGGIDFGAIAQIDASGTVTPFTSTLSLTTLIGSAVYEAFTFIDLGGAGCDTPTAQNSQVKIISACSVFGGQGYYGSTWNKVPTTGANNYGILVSGLGGASINYGHILVEIKTSPLNLPCPSGYKCVNSYVNNNDIVLQANSTLSAVALNNVPIDFSVLSSKEMMIYETYVNGTNISNTNKPFGWYLTVNGTLPLQANYSPLNDTNVAMAMVNYEGKTTYLYVAKNLGEQLLPDSGLGKNPYPNCPQSSTLFLCARVIVSLSGTTTFNAMSAILNFTGPAQQNRGVSFICFNSVLTASFFTFGGASCNGNTTTTLPWFNIQNSYSLGFFAQSGQTAPITFGSSGTSATFSERANAVYYWVPNPTTNTPAETNSGGYFGWLGRSLGNTWNSITGILAPLGAPLANFGNSLLGTFASALSQFYTIIIQTLRTVLNSIGNFLGLGNIGDSLIAIFGALGVILINIVSVVIGFFTIVAQVVSSALTTMITGGITVFNGLVTLVLIIYNLVLNSSWSLSVIIFLDYCYGMLMLYFKGMKGLWMWLRLNLFIFLLLPNIAWEIFDDVTRGYERIKIMITGYV